jgi:8-oxo-dGTP pyrophosphatase MutT (NUDIX family)
MSEPQILDIAELDLPVESFDWPFARERADDIRSHWEARRAANPALFDGRVLLMFRHTIETRADGRLALRGAYFETAYSNFLAWRDFRLVDSQICSCFSMAALQSADGAFLLGEMSAHTANAGQIYFAAGTPDRSDVFDGRVDLTASVMRELQEETGIAAQETYFDESWLVVHTPPRIACMKTMRLGLDAAAAKARIEAFLGNEKDPELSAVHIVRSLADLEGKRTPDFMRIYLAQAALGHG